MSPAWRLPAPRSRAGGRGWWAAPSATACSGAPTADLDVVVDGDPAQAARALVARAGARAACFALSEDFGAWRVVARDRSWQVDVEPLRGGSLEADLALRDFTVNAIAEPLAGGDADRPARRPRRPRATPPADRRRRARSPKTRCACCASCASPSSWTSSRTPRR